MGSVHSLETTLHSLQQTYLRPSIHTTQNFKWSRYTLTIQRQPCSGSVWPVCPKNGKSDPHCWWREGSTQFAQQLESAVTAPPLVGSVAWSRLWYPQLGHPDESSAKCRAGFARCLLSINSPHHLITSCSWQTLSMLSADHLPILIRLQLKTTTIPGLRRTYVNLKKANWDRYRQEVEADLSKRSLPFR